MSFSIHPIGKKRKKQKRFPWQSALTIGLAVAKPLWDLGRKFAKRKNADVRTKKIITLGAAIIVSVTMALLALSFLISLGGLSLSSAMRATGIPVGTDENGMTNILLLGQGDETGQDLTDTIIIASIDPVKTKSISLLSLPRDLYFLHTDHAMATEKGKLNALWRDNRIALFAKGEDREKTHLLSLQQLGKEIGAAFGLPIHHIVMVDFEAFEKAVDAFGGIDVDVPETIHDTEYPGPDYTYQTFHIDAGMQHMDGKTALKYVRTRSTTSDFDRSARQQQILRATLEQGRSAGILKNPGKIVELFGILSEHMLTDLKTRQIVTLASIVKGITQENILTLQLNNVNGLYEEQQWKGGILYAPPRYLFEGDSVLLPVSIPEFPVTWKQVQTFVELYIRNRELYLPRSTFSILNGGAQEGSAGRIGRELIKFGFEVETVRNVPRNKEFETSTIIYENNDQKEIATFFGKILDAEVEEITEEWKSILQNRAGSVTIILGKDFEFGYFQDAVDMTSY